MSGSVSAAVWDPALSVRGGRLYFEGCEVEGLARQYGTPLYVVSEDQLRRNYRRYLQAFAERWREGTVHILPSIKANFALALRAILTQEGAGCDTFGEGEWYAAQRTGVDPALISVNGSSKSTRLLRSAVAAGARITLDSEVELERVRGLARAAGQKARVRFRLRPDYEGLDAPSDFDPDGATVQTVLRRYKPGIPTGRLLEVGREAIHAPELEVTGVMVHIGRQSTELAVWKKMVESVGVSIAKLSNAWGGWEPAEIDLGGGFAAPRDPMTRTGGTDAGSPPKPRAPTIEQYAEVLTGTLRDSLVSRGIRVEGKTLEVEPGRGLYADAGIHLTTVTNLKHDPGPLPRRWVETDTSEMFLLDSLIEHNRWTPVSAVHADAPSVQTVDVVGISCGFDVVVADAALPAVGVGDILALLDTGAYQDACATNFNAMPRPGTVLVNGTDSEWIKRPETVDDVFRRDSIPARLEPIRVGSR
jgi:diaminopimelate decarboxylase